MSYKTLIGPKPLLIRFDKIDGFIGIYDGTRYLILLGFGTYDTIYNRIRYLIRGRSGITLVFCHYYPKIKVDLYDSFPIVKTLTLHNVIIHIKSVVSKDQNHYFYNTFLEECSYQLAKKITKFFLIV